MAVTLKGYSSFLILSILVFFFTPNRILSGKEAALPNYISGDSFRSFADFVFDLNPGSDSAASICKNIKPGDVVFVQTLRLGAFFAKVHRHIKVPYILLTHNGDEPVPGEWYPHLDSDKLIAWFGQNVEHRTHPKLIPIPIGVGNACYHYGNQRMLFEAEKCKDLAVKNIFLYLNVNLKGRHPERTKVYNLFSKQPYCTLAEKRTFTEYLNDILSSEFVLSPRGIGLDCHRTWESMLLNAIPIIISSASDPLYEDLPVVIVNEWEEIDENFLGRKKTEMKLRKYRMEKLYMDYWIDLINSKRERL